VALAAFIMAIFALSIAATTGASTFFGAVRDEPPPARTHQAPNREAHYRWLAQFQRDYGTDMMVRVREVFTEWVWRDR
jgi:hypothetical protein